MPWHVEVMNGDYCVVKDSDGTVEGCHATGSEAEDHMAALYASEAERVGLIDWLRRTFSPLRTLFPFVMREWSGDASNYDSTAAYCSACLIDVNAAAGRDEKAQSHCMLPVKSPGSDSMNWEGVQAAAGGHGIQAVKKPDDVSGDDWDSALASAANKIISVYNSHDETAPDAVYKIAGKEPPKEEGMSERVMSMSMVWEQVYARMWDDEKLSEAWIHDLYLGDGEPFIIVSLQGKLYRLNLVVEGDVVSLGEMQPVEIEFPPSERLATKTVVREVEPGIFRWFSISATSVLNKDGEIDSKALFDSFVAHVAETGEYPVRRYHHLGDDRFITGECDFVARDEHVLVTSGVFNDSQLAKLEIKARQEHPDEWGESIGYLPTEPPELVEISGVEIPTYNAGVLREISTVESKNACSWFTTTAVREEVMRMGLTERAWEGLLKLFSGDEEAAHEFVGELELTNRTISEEGLISREETEDNEDVENPETEGDPESPEGVIREGEPQELILTDEAVEAIVERFGAALTPLVERMDAIEEKLADAAKERAQVTSDAGEAIEALVSRVEALEEDEDEKLQRRLEDASPRMRRTVVSYRPRVEREQEEDNGREKAPLAVKAEETLSAIPE